jgi:hypothetical protein
MKDQDRLVRSCGPRCVPSDPNADRLDLPCHDGWLTGRGQVALCLMSQRRAAAQLPGGKPLCSALFRISEKQNAKGTPPNGTCQTDCTGSAPRFTAIGVSLRYETRHFNQATMRTPGPVLSLAAGRKVAGQYCVSRRKRRQKEHMRCNPTYISLMECCLSQRFFDVLRSRMVRTAAPPMTSLTLGRIYNSRSLRPFNSGRKRGTRESSQDLGWRLKRCGGAVGDNG